MAEEKVTIALNTTREDIRAVFEENYSLNRAFDVFWRGSDMDDWIEKKAVQDLEENGISTEGCDLHEIFKKQAMLTLLQQTMKRFVTEHAKVPFESCILKVIREESKDIIKRMKDLHVEAIEEINTRKSFTEFLKFLLS